ncbi:MAG: hypothetical protein GWN64_11380, partial [Candidatus Thorarchaeota archaeon]|nr:hypothetical protein [Candidatus Thorarchaeota archaeon]
MQKLIGDAELYQDLIRLEEDSLNVEIKLTDKNESVTLIVNQNLSVIKGIHQPDYKLTMT